MKYFVTGATGFIGGRLAGQLVAAGHEVIALVRDPERATQLASTGVQLAPGDITDRESMRSPMQGVDGVFHVAAWYKVGVRDKSPGHATNVVGTRNVLELMRELRIPRGVYTSTLAVNSDTRGRLVDESYRSTGPWLSVYEKTKWQAHYEVAEPMMRAGLPLVIVMPGLTYGPGDLGPTHDFMHDFLRGRLHVAPKKTAFCWGHVDDTARAHVLAMERGQLGATYIVAGADHTMLEVVEMLAAYTKLPPPRLHPSPATLKVLAAVMQALGAVVPLPTMYTAETLRSIAGATYIGDNSKARRELGLDVRRLPEGLYETIDFEMSQLGMQKP